MTIKFLESGSSATYGTQFWSTVGSPTSDTTSLAGSARSILTNSSNLLLKIGVLADAGRRISFYWKPTSVASGSIILKIQASGVDSFRIALNASSIIILTDGAGTPLTGGGSADTVLTINTLYRICLSYTVTNTTTNRIKVYLWNGTTLTTEIDATNVTISQASTTDIQFLSSAYHAHFYIDDTSDLSDTGNVLVVPKLPAASNTNNFDTLIGSATNRWDYVSERALSETQGIQHAASTDVQENFILQSPAVGDADITGATILGRTAWIWAKRGSNAGTITFRSAHSANSSSVAITTPASGDLIVVCAYRNNSTTAPSLATNYTSADTQGPGGSSNSTRLGWKISDGTETTSGTWTNATNVTVQIFRSTATIAFGAFTATAGNSAALSYGTLSMQVSDGSSWVAGFGNAKAATAGMNGTLTVLDNNNTNQTTVNGLDTHNGVSSYSAETLNVTGSGRWITYSVEIKSGTVSSGTPKLMDNGTETAVTLTDTSALYTVISTDTAYPSNVAGIGMRSSNAAPDTFLYECGTIIAYIDPMQAELIGRPEGTIGQQQMTQLIAQ